MAASPISLMPENLEKEVTPQDVADLIAYLRQAFGPPAAAGRRCSTTIPVSPSVLNQGEGRAVLDTADRFAGQRVAAHHAAAALVAADSRLAVPDRREPRARRVPLPAIRLEVVRRPGRDDRTGRSTATGRPRTNRSGGTTAARTPPAGPPCRSRPKRRSEWVVVTRDLWKDFGDFTLTGIAPTAIGGDALFDRIELLRELPPAR